MLTNQLSRSAPKLIERYARRAKSRTLFRDLVDTRATIDIGQKEITVRFQKRAHNPLLRKAGFDQKHPAIPWLGKKVLSLVFG